MRSIDTILSIDTSCDETSVSVTHMRQVLSNVLSSQVEIHRKYGGVFPTEAKRAHQEKIDSVVIESLKRARTKIEKLDAIAVTYGPGLAPALEVGIKKAKELAKEYHKPLIAVNHLEGHLLSPLAQNSTGNGTYRLDPFDKSNYPVLGILVSGAHTELVKISQIGEYQILGQTRDDAAGEAFDKVGRMLGISYPAGEFIEKLAKQGDNKKFDFPIPMIRDSSLDFSFSGIKTAVLYKVKELTESKLKQIQLGKATDLDKKEICDLAASFQNVVVKSIILKLKMALELYDFKSVWLGGGVAANVYLRNEIRKTLNSYNLKLYIPYSKRLYMDNASMIGVSAWFKAQKNEFCIDIDSLDRVPGLLLVDHIFFYGFKT